MTSAISSSGFSGWRHIRRLETHENSSEHTKCSTIWITQRDKKLVLDKQLLELIQTETTYYRKGLAFRGYDEKFGSLHNGNFMGALELLAEFDSFLQEHIK